MRYFTCAIIYMIYKIWYYYLKNAKMISVYLSVTLYGFTLKIAYKSYP